MTGLSGKARSAVIWSMGSNLSRDLLSFASMLVLVRLLAPASYGEFTITTSIISFITWISFQTFVPYVVQVQDEGDVQYQSHFTAGGVLQVGAFLVANSIAFGMRLFPTYLPIAPYVHVYSTALLLGWPSEFRKAMLTRQYQWKRIALLNTTGIISSAIFGPLLAWSGAGTYALVLPGLLIHLPYIFDLFFIEKWRPTWEWSWTAYRPAAVFGLTRVGSGLTSGSRMILESAVLVVAIGLPGLGIFTRALSLAQMFCTRFAAEFLQAIYPVLPRIDQAPENRIRVGGLVVRLVAWVSFPVAAVLATQAAPIVEVIYGAKWGAVVPLLPWTLLLAALTSLVTACTNLILASQRPRHCLVIDSLFLAGTALALSVTWSAGTVTYLQCLIAVQVLLLVLLLYWLCQFRVLDLLGIRQAILPPTFSVALAWWVASGLSLMLGPATKSTSLGLILWSLAWGTAFAAAYLATLRLLFADPFEKLIEQFPGSGTIKRILFFREHSNAGG